MLSSTQSKLRYSIELLANMASCDISSHYSFLCLFGRQSKNVTIEAKH